MTDGEGRVDDDGAHFGQGAARTLLGHLEARGEQLMEQLAEARSGMRGMRYEAESLRVDAGRAQVFNALVFAALVEAERDRLADELTWRRRPWLVRLLDALRTRPDPRRRPF